MTWALSAQPTTFRAARRPVRRPKALDTTATRHHPMHTTTNEKDRLDMASHRLAADHALNGRGRRALLQVPSDHWRVVQRGIIVVEQRPWDAHEQRERRAPGCRLLEWRAA